jgi:hypothetical protein
MVRPRASERNLQIALEFSKMLISRTLNRELVRETQIHCRGPRSLHSVFSVCLPQLTRDIGAMRPKNRAGVTLVELNKALNGVGLRCLFCLHFIAIIVLLCAGLFRSVRRCEGQDGSRTRYRVFETLASNLAKTILNSRNNFITFILVQLRYLHFLFGTHQFLYKMIHLL